MFNGLLNDTHDDTLSSKRVITFGAFLLCAIAFIANLFWDQDVTQFMFDSMIYLAMVGIGATAVEKFVPLNKSDSKKDTQ